MRYVELPINKKVEQLLTTIIHLETECEEGKGQAEQKCAVGGTEDQADQNCACGRTDIQGDQKCEAGEEVIEIEQKCAASCPMVRAEQRCAAGKGDVRADRGCEAGKEEGQGKQICADRGRGVGARKKDVRAELLPSRDEISQMDNSRRQESTRGHDKDPDKTSSWSQMRASRNFLLEKDEEWQELTSMETRKLERDVKKLKSEIMKRKKSKYGRAGNSKLSLLEEAVIISQTRRKSELAEVRKNLGRKEAGRKGWKMENIPNGNIPEGRKEIEEQWTKLASNMRKIETLERWVDAQWMGQSSLEQQRGMAKRVELDGRDEVEYSKSEGMLREKEGKTEEMQKTAWSFWKENEATRRRKKIDDGEENIHTNARIEKTIQVEREVENVPLENFRNNDSISIQNNLKDIDKNEGNVIGDNAQ